MDIHELQTLERRPPLVGDLAFLVAGLVVLVAGVALVYGATTYQFDGPPTCDGEVMSPGDSCLVFGGGKSYDYDTGVRQQEAWGQTWRLLVGLLVMGVGAALLWGGASRLGERWLRAPFLVAGGLLIAAAGYLLTVGTAATVTGAVVAAAGAVWVLTDSGSEALSRAAVYLAGLVLLAGAAALVVSAASYRPAGKGYGLNWDDQLNLFVMEVVQQHGDWVRLVLAAVAVAGALVLIKASASGPTFLAAALVAVAAGAVALRNGGGLTAQIALAVAVLVAGYFLLWALAGLRGPGQITRSAV